MSQGILHCTKDGWVISYQTKEDQFGIASFEIEKTVPVHPDDVWGLQASIGQMVDNDGRRVNFEIISETVDGKNVLYGRITGPVFG